MITYFKVVSGERTVGVFCRISDEAGERAEVFASNLSWGPASQDLFRDGPEKLAEIPAGEAGSITARLRREASREQ